MNKETNYRLKHLELAISVLWESEAPFEVSFLCKFRVWVPSALDQTTARSMRKMICLISH